MLGVILMGPRIGLLLLFIGCMLFGFMTGMNFQIMMVAVIGGSAAVMALLTLRQRRDILRAGLISGIATALAILTIRFIDDPATVDCPTDPSTCGVPPIGTRIGGIPDVIQHEENGLLIAPKSSAEIRDAILRLFKDKELALKLARKGLETSRHFEWERIMRGVDNIYQSVLS